MDNIKSFTIEVRIVVSGFGCLPQDITKLIGVEPTKMWIKGGVVHPKAINTHHENGWMLSSPCDSVNSTIDNQVLALSELLKNNLEHFKMLPKMSEVELSCIVYAYEYFPPINFSPDTVLFLSRIGAGIDMDIYDLQDSDPEKPGRLG